MINSKNNINNSRVSKQTIIILSLIVMLTITAISTIEIAANKYDWNDDVTEITVSYGDTLWTIAKKIAPNVDPRKVVWEIEVLNDIKSSHIYPGQTLQVPLYES